MCPAWTVFVILTIFGVQCQRPERIKLARFDAQRQWPVHIKLARCGSKALVYLALWKAALAYQLPVIPSIAAVRPLIQ